MIGPDFTRPARADEHDEIAALLVDAFGRHAEANLLQRLRSDGDLWLELVKPWDGVIAGYAALSRMKEPEGWACLGPVAVLPRFQRSAAAPMPALGRYFAIGTRLVREIATAMQTPADVCVLGHQIPRAIVVVGRPDFYERAGFSAERARNLTSPYPIAHTLIARPGHDAPTGDLIYPAAFSSVA